MKNKKTHYLELKSLILQNFATFSNQEVHFTSGLNAIIGETGSGKSLLMEALAMVLGERADKKVVRSGHDFASVEARFVTEGLETKKFLDDLGYPIDGDEVVIKRLIYTEGKSKSFLNLNQCSLQTLQEFTREFIDLVGQFENQRLLSSTYQLELLDEFAQHTPQVATYAGMFKEYAALKAKKNALLEQEKFRLQQIDFLKFQVQEINDLSPSVKEEERLSELKRSVVNNDLQEKTVSYIQQCLDGNDERQGLLTLASQIHHSVIKIRNFLPQSIIQKFDDFFALAKDFEQDIKNFRIHSLSEEEIATVIDNLDKYQKLKRKHGGTIPQILEQHEKFKMELSEYEQQETQYAEIDKQLAIFNEKLLQMASSLSAKRVAAAKKLSQELTNQLQQLNMKGSLVSIELLKLNEITPHGLDQLVFKVQTNPGEGLHELHSIASGGELSRILLCLRQISSSTGKISIFLFDEVDTGIGGETALLLGQHLSDLSKKIQVLAITHLPQIAFNADSLIKVEKQINKENNKQRTISKVTHFQTKQQVIKQAQDMSVLKLL